MSKCHYVVLTQNFVSLPAVEMKTPKCICFRGGLYRKNLNAAQCQIMSSRFILHSNAVGDLRLQYLLAVNEILIWMVDPSVTR